MSLPLSKSAGTVLIGVLYLAAALGAACSKEFRDDIVRSCRQPLTAALALFCAVAYVGILYTAKPSDGLDVANKFPSLPAIYFIVALLLQSERSEEARARKAERVLFSFLAGLTALNLIGVLTFLGVVGDAKDALPLSPLGMHHIWFSNVNALGLYTAISFLLFSRSGQTARARAILGGFVLLSALCILLSTSRAAWFGIASTALIMAAVLIKSTRTILLVVLFSILTSALAYRFVPIVHDRVRLIVEDVALYSADKRAESSTGDRLLLWKASLLMFESQPLIGVGTGDFHRTMIKYRIARVMPRRLLRFNQPHNMYLFSLATNGIAGLAALLYIFYRIVRSAAPLVRSDGGARLFAFLAMATAVHFMVAGLVDSFFNIQILRFSFAFIMGVCIRGSMNSADRA